jgi:hypothetical protein
MLVCSEPIKANYIIGVYTFLLSYFHKGFHMKIKGELYVTLSKVEMPSNTCKYIYTVEANVRFC